MEVLVKMDKEQYCVQCQSILEPIKDIGGVCRNPLCPNYI